MTQLEIEPSTAKKLQDVSQKAQKSVDEILLLLLNNFGHTIIEAGEMTQDADTWTDEELAHLLKPEQPLTGKEMVEGGFIGGWEHKQIDDPVAFLEQQRANRRKNKFA